MIAKAISVRSPWWWFILHAGKDIENRDWYTNFRGTVYLHASKWWALVGVWEAIEDAFLCMLGMDFHWVDKLRREIDVRSMRGSSGCIVGSVDIVGCVSHSDSPWFFGKYGFVLANPVAFETPIPCKGALGFFTVPDDVLAEIGASLRQPGVLLGGELQPDGSASLGDGVLERGAIFEDVALAPALVDLDDLVGSGEGELAGERGTAILVEEADMPSLATHEVHQDAVLRGLPAAARGLHEVRHGGIVSELKAKMSTGPQVSEKAGLR